MTSQLAIITPNGDAPTLLPTSGRLVLGSSSERADLVFNSQGVADVHSVIARTKDGGWAIQDMGSEFGTMVDGRSVDVARLTAGQTILIASVSIKVVESGVTQEKEAPTPPRVAAAKEPKEPATPRPTAKKVTTHILDIPGYSIQETLGKGGMGAVFRARQDRLNRDVALKILSPRLAADAEFVRRFHKEAQAVAALNHPNIVTVYDVGEASGTHFIAMEYMDDNSLEELLAKEGRLPWKRVAELLLGAARGLTYAESRRIVHRDIKPSNLMLNSDDQVKISDLGLAHRDTDATEDGPVFGTPHFIAPEQIRGELVDRRCDIYSLGVTGYQLLTGYTPFEGVSSREILRAVLKDEFEPIEAHLSGTPRALSDLIERMIARDPDDRPQSAESVVSHLQIVLAGQANSPGDAQPKASEGGSLLKIAGGVIVFAALCAGYLLTKDEPKPAVVDDTKTAKSPAADREEPPAKAPSDTAAQGPLIPTQDTTPAEDDTAQKLFESEAEVEFLRMESSDLTLEERRVKLIELAEKFNGTSAAAKALAQAQINGALIEQERAAAEALRSTRQKVIDDLTRAAALTSSPTFPAKALADILAVPGQDALAADEQFTKARALLRDQVCIKALAECGALFDQAKQDLTNPDQQVAKQALQGLVARLQLPKATGLNRPTGYEDLRRLEADARGLLNDLDRQRALASSSLAVADGFTIASYCHSQADDGLLAHIRGLKLEAAAAKLRELDGQIRSHERSAHIAQLASDLETASAALKTLVSSYGQWKRKTVTDPRPARSSEEAVAITAEGLTVKTTDGVDFISWASFTANPDALQKLFYKRLNRDWSQDERRGIGIILNFSATLNALKVAAKAFGAPATLKAKKTDALLESLTISDEWINGDDGIDQNYSAAAAIFEGLALAADSQWAAAESTIRFTSREHSGSLLILLLSDGSPPHDPNSVTAPEKATEGPALPSDAPSLPASPEEE